MKWYFIDESIVDGERRQGPYSIDEIQDFVNSGKITDETLVWHSGEESWKPWKETFEAQNGTSRDELLQETINMLLKEQQRTKIYGGFFVRLVAFLIDNVILSLAGGIVLGILSFAGVIDLAPVIEGLREYINAPGTAEAIEKLMSVPGMSTAIYIGTFIQTLYFVIFGAKISSTPGKRLFKLRIETKNGQPLNWGSSILRYMASIFTLITLMFYAIGYLIVCLDPKRRALHDWIARTYVVYQEKDSNSANSASASGKNDAEEK